MRGISGRRVEKISARADVRTMCSFTSQSDMAPTIHQPTYRPQVHTMAVSCATATSVDHTRKMGGEKGREGGGSPLFCVREVFFLWRGGGGRRGSSLGREKVGRENNVREAEILCT